MGALASLVRSRSSHHGEPDSPFTERGNKLGANLLSFVFVWWLWEKILIIYLNYLCAHCQPEQTCGGLWQTCTHIWKHSGHQPLLIPRSVLQLAEQRFPFGRLCVLPLCRQQCGNMSGSVVGICLAAILWSSASVSQKRACASLKEQGSGIGVLASGRRWGAQLGKVPLTGEAGMLWVRMWSSAGGMVGRKHFSNLLHAIAMMWPLLSQVVLTRYMSVRCCLSLGIVEVWADGWFWLNQALYVKQDSVDNSSFGEAGCPGDLLSLLKYRCYLERHFLILLRWCILWVEESTGFSDWAKSILTFWKELECFSCCFKAAVSSLKW